MWWHITLAYTKRLAFSSLILVIVALCSPVYLALPRSVHTPSTNCLLKTNLRSCANDLMPIPTQNFLNRVSGVRDGVAPIVKCAVTHVSSQVLYMSAGWHPFRCSNHTCGSRLDLDPTPYTTNVHLASNPDLLKVSYFDSLMKKNLEWLGLVSIPVWTSTINKPDWLERNSCQKMWSESTILCVLRIIISLLCAQ